MYNMMWSKCNQNEERKLKSEHNGFYRFVEFEDIGGVNEWSTCYQRFFRIYLIFSPLKPRDPFVWTSLAGCYPHKYPKPLVDKQAYSGPKQAENHSFTHQPTLKPDSNFIAIFSFFFFSKKILYAKIVVTNHIILF